MKTLIIAFLLLCNISYAGNINYKLSDFSYVDHNGNNVLIVPTNKATLDKYLDKQSPVVSLILEKHGAKVKDIENHFVPNFYILTFDSYESMLDVVNETNCLPVVESDGKMYSLQNYINIIVPNRMSFSDLAEKLHKLLNIKVDTNFAGEGNAVLTIYRKSSTEDFYTLQVTTYDDLHNPLFMVNYINNSHTFVRAEPILYPFRNYKAKYKMISHGVGTIGEKRYLNFIISMPEDDKLSTIPLLDKDEITKFLDEQSSHLDKYFKLYNPIVKESISDGNRVYDISYPIDFYITGTFGVMYPTFRTDKKEYIYMEDRSESFTVVSILSPKSKDIETTVSDVIIPSPALNQMNLILLMFVAFFIGFLLVWILCDIITKPKLQEVHIPSDFDVVKDKVKSSLNNKNWKDLYCQLLKSCGDAPKEIVVELEKAYSEKLEPDFDIIRNWLK